MLAMKKSAELNQIDISYYAKDGRLTAEPDGKVFEWRKMIDAVINLGRPLTENEMEKYRIK
jgi:hypothetical protein